MPTTVSMFYGLSGPLPFVDVDVDRDNHLYLDPHAIRLSHSPAPFAAQAVQCMDTFFNEVTQCIIDGTPQRLARGESLLQRFTEPWETRLGMSAEGFFGHGGADEIGSLIWETLNGDVEALVRIGVLHQLEDIPLFVEGVDRDITSDLTTRIVYSALSAFTNAMMERFPALDATAGTFLMQMWDVDECEWVERAVRLPVAAGRPLLLVPKEWARRNLLMSATRYYETSVLSFAQLEQAVVAADGRVLKTPKDKLQKQADLARGRGTIIRVTARAIANRHDLLAEFKQFVAGRFRPDPEASTDAAA